MTDPDAGPAEPVHPSYPSRAAAARALGISPRRLSALAEAGAPLPPEGPIPSLPLLEWAWANRARFRTRATSDDALDREKLRSLKQANDARAQKHLAQARQLVSACFSRARDGLRQRLGGPGLARLLAAAAGPQGSAGPRLAAEITRLVDSALDQALD